MSRGAVKDLEDRVAALERRRHDRQPTSTIMSKEEAAAKLKALAEVYGRMCPEKGPAYQDDNTRITDRLDAIILLLIELGDTG